MNEKMPKVFISLANEDKERFVESFAKKLTTKGINPWAYFWELLPGDSLVDKIFEEGIKNADAIIVIISKFSINKPWVREELNAAFIKKIENKIKLIPVIIDDCEIPECLKYTVWQKIKDMKHYDEEFNRIVSSILNYSLKPQINKVPGYVDSNIEILPELNKIDSIILKCIGELTVKEGYPHVDANDLFAMVIHYDIDKQNIEESISVLERRNYLKVQWSFGGKLNFSVASPTLFGFNEYCKYFVEDYNKKILDVGYWLINNGETNSQKIIEELKIPTAIVHHILHLLENNNFLSVQDFTSNVTYVSDISPDLKRYLEENA